jgi:succinate dehydrogenase hydrophobic anchor subunit
MAVGGAFWSQFVNGIKAIMSFNSLGALFTWLAIFTSFPSNIFTAYLSREEDATIATLVLAVAPGVSGVIMGFKQIMQQYYQPAGWTTWLSMAIVLASVILYKVFGIIAKKRDGYVEINNS